MPIRPKKVINIIFTVIILLLAIPATAILATWNTLPNDTLYPLKRALEKSALALTPKSLLETKLHFAFLDRRSEEATVALIQKPGDQQILDDLLTEAKAAQFSTFNLKSNDDKITASLELIEKVSKTSEQLSQVKSEISDSPSDNYPESFGSYINSSEPPSTQPDYQPTNNTQTTPSLSTPTAPTQEASTTQTEPVPITIPSSKTTSPSKPTPITTQPQASPVITPPTTSPTTTQAITQTQQDLQEIATNLEQQLETQELDQEQQQKLETIKKEKERSKLIKKPKLPDNKQRPSPVSDGKIEASETKQCWNLVIESQSLYDGFPSWPSTCRGRKNRGGCGRAFMRLTETEIEKYNQWISNGKPSPSCF